MKQYYKLITEYPNSDKIGTIYFTDDLLGHTIVCKKTETGSRILDVPNISEKNLESKFFEKFLQISEDGFPIFKGDTVFYLDENNHVKAYTAYVTKFYDSTYSPKFYKFEENCEKYQQEIYKNSLPRSWDEICDKSGYHITGDGNNCQNLCATPKQALSQLAFAQLTQLAKKMNKEWEPDWNDNNYQSKFVIKRHNNGLTTDEYQNIYHEICFKSAKLRDFSLKNHGQLWKDYYQLD